MTNEPIFEKLSREYAARGKSYERMTAPYLSPVKPLGLAKQPLMQTPVYGPDQHLDGPFREPLPKRTLANLIKLPEPDPELVKHFQDFISKAPLQILQGTPAGSFIKSMEPEKQENGDVVLEAEVMIPTGSEVDETMMLRALKPKADLREKGIQLAKPKTAEIDDKAIVFVERRVTAEDILAPGFQMTDVIYELGQEFAEKHPDFEVVEVRVKDALYGDKIVTLWGDETKQTDESVNAASNEENDEDNEPVILAPNFWKIRDEE